MTELEYFSELKNHLLRIFCEANPHFNGGLKDFGVREIARFQEMLQEKTGGRVSEKWFYTHLKKDHDRLPRIDVLDLLSEFVGYENWAGFKTTLGHQATAKEKNQKLNYRKVMVLIAAGLFAFFTFMMVVSAWNIGSMVKYEICIVDMMTNKRIVEVPIKVEVFRKGESPEIFRPDEKGCFVFEIEGEQIEFTLQANYYQTDTIKRILREENQKETIALRRDDYAWMIHVFSENKIADWEKRKEQLEMMIAEEAMIFQVDEQSGRAMELFNKPEFIDKLTLPISSLGKLEVLRTEYDEEGKIKTLHFCQKK